MNDLFSATSTITILLADVDLGFPGPGEFKSVEEYTDEIFNYAWDAGIVPFAMAAIGFKILMWFLYAAKGE